jgi:hypothetical protein
MSVMRLPALAVFVLPRVEEHLRQHDLGEMSLLDGIAEASLMRDGEAEGERVQESFDLTRVALRAGREHRAHAVGKVLPNSESRRQRNHEAAKSGIPKRKKITTHPRLSCKIEYLLTSNHRDGSIASEFFTGDYFFIGAIVLSWWTIWTLVRIIKGAILLHDQRPIPQPTSWLFG